MTSLNPTGDREKVVSKLPAWLRQDLKIRTAERGVDIQDAVTEGITAWRSITPHRSPVDTSGADSFSTWLPAGLWDGFKADCAQHGVSFAQGLAQSVHLWLEMNPSPSTSAAAPVIVQRKIVCNQKGGVGKTAVSGGLGQALAEDGEDGGGPLRVLLVDFDPQSHLTKQLGVQPLPIGGDSLTNHMAGDAKGDIADLVVVIGEERFGKRLHLLPACQDAFLLDVKLSTVRAREAALERALAPLESGYDVIVIDCPPSLGLSMDAAAYYGRRRDGEPEMMSGVLVVVQAEDTSADAYELLTAQIADLSDDLGIAIDYLGLVVNLYDSRRGYVATSSLEAWKAIGSPPVVGVVPDLKEQREAVRMKRPLLAYAPKSEQAAVMRTLARAVS